MEDIINSIMDEGKKATPVLNTASEYINQWDIIAFTDGSCIGKRQGAKFGGSGVYLYSTKEQNYNGFKIIKRHVGETILYLSAVEDKKIKEYNSLDNMNNICNGENCCKIAYTHDKKCSKHKIETSKIVAKYFTYTPTNIRSEGLAILISLWAGLAFINKGANKKIKKSAIKESILQELYNLENLDMDNLQSLSYEGVIITDKEKLNIAPGKKIMVVTDSLFWIDLITKWLSKWIRTRTIEDRKNIDIILLIIKLLANLKKSNIHVFFQHVEGHKDKKSAGEDLNIYYRGNILADKLATHASKSEDNNLIVL